MKKVAVIIADDAVIDPVIDVHRLSEIGATWGSWRQWHQCHPNNVICQDAEQARKMVAAGFTSVCNFFVPQAIHTELAHTRAWAGSAVNTDQTVATCLAATTAQVLVMLGFSTVDPVICDVISQGGQQWVFIGGEHDELKKFSNVHYDTLENVLD